MNRIFIPDALINPKEIRHSAKGSSWKEHKYIMKKDGTYYYSGDMKGGSSKSGDSSDDKDQEAYDKFMSDYDELLKKSGVEDDPDRMLFDTVDRFREFYDKLYGKSSKDSISDADLKKIMDKYNDRKNDTRVRTDADLSDKDVDKLASEVIKGSFDNGGSRKELLGEAYEKVQSRVNEILKGRKSKEKVSSATEKDKESTKSALDKVGSTKMKSNVDSDTRKKMSSSKKK